MLSKSKRHLSEYPFAIRKYLLRFTKTFTFAHSDVCPSPLYWSKFAPFAVEKDRHALSNALTTSLTDDQPLRYTEAGMLPFTTSKRITVSKLIQKEK
jgi:hypothetical protein